MDTRLFTRSYGRRTNAKLVGTLHASFPLAAAWMRALALAAGVPATESSCRQYAQRSTARQFARSAASGPVLAANGADQQPRAEVAVELGRQGPDLARTPRSKVALS